MRPRGRGYGRRWPDIINQLSEWGVNFDNKDNVCLTREGGHSHRRVVHVADATGKPPNPD